MCLLRTHPRMPASKRLNRGYKHVVGLVGAWLELKSLLLLAQGKEKGGPHFSYWERIVCHEVQSDESRVLQPKLGPRATVLSEALYL